MSDSRSYSRSLIIKGHGYPLFNPQPFDDLPLASRRKGVEIGDVGIVTSDGSFDLLFNICRAATDPLNRFGVPEGFEQVKLSPGDIAPQQMYFRPGADISNTKISKRRLDIDASTDGNVFLPFTIGATVEISTHSKTAAVLLLPTGASRTNLRPRRIFRDYALKHGQRWYAFANGALDRMVGNGDLYLVTGADKCAAWSLAALENHAEGCALSLKLTAAAAPASVGASCAWEWECASAFANSGPRRPGKEDEAWAGDVENQCVFVRGFKVAVRPKPWRMLGTVKVKSIEDLKPEAVAARGRSLPFASSRRSSDGSSRSYSGDQEHNKAYHPSDVVNAYLLDACPSAVVAVTHDDEWGAVIADGSGIPTDAELLEHLFERYTFASRADGVCLQHLDAAGVDEPASPTELPKTIGPPQPPATPAYDDFEDRAPDAKPDGENLEALGTSVLCLITTDLIMAMYPRLDVTPSARLRQLLLEDATLDKIAERKLPKLQEPKTPDGSRGFKMSVAMLYRTEGLESVKTLLDPVLHPYATRAHQHLFLSVSSSSKEGPAPPVAGPSTHNTSDSPTSQSQDLVRFNEAVQKANRCAEWKYAQATGTSSAWSAEVRVDGEVFGRGEGGTKKVARNEAAKEALGRL